MINKDNTFAAEHHSKVKSKSAVVLTIAGTILVIIACYGVTFTNDVDYAVVLVFGFIISLFGFINLKQ